MKRISFFPHLFVAGLLRSTAPAAVLLAAVLGLCATASAQTAPAPDGRPETVITSDELDMVGGDDANHFFFRRNVKIQATNMIATCDEMEVISARQSASLNKIRNGSNDAAPAKGADAAKGGSGNAPAADGAATGTPDASANIGSISEIIMTGNVVITQEGRRATAGKAILYPQEGRVVLSDSPKVTDEQGTLSGWRMELYRDEKKVRILSDPNNRTRVTLPAMGDLGYREPAKAPAEETAPSTPPSGAAQPAADATGTAPSAPAAPGSANSPAASGTPAAAQPVAAPKVEEVKKESSNTRGWNPVNSRRR